MLSSQALSESICKGEQTLVLSPQPPDGGLVNIAIAVFQQSGVEWKAIFLWCNGGLFIEKQLSNEIEGILSANVHINMPSG